MYFDDGVIW